MSSVASRLALSLAQLRAHYQVVVIGSGYGGGVAASRLARAGQSVCVLERGREFVAGEFPNTLSKAAAEFQIDIAEKHFGNQTGLYDFRINADMNVMIGCGLGGTSLINAGVALPADPRVFDDACWPAAVRAEAQLPDSPLATGYQRAEHMLSPRTYPDAGAETSSGDEPDKFPPLEKMAAHQKSAQHMDQPFYRTPINVTFADGINAAGVAQKACVNCGDCISGCNHAAKNTTQMNYLPDAVNFGAQIFTEVKVTRIAKTTDATGRSEWRVYLHVQGIGREQFSAPELFVLADTVVLAAGTLGSTEILLRSQAHGLQLSDRIGKRFTGNGDVLGFAYNCDEPINGVGFGDNEIDGRKPVGPCITSIIDSRATPVLDDGSVIEEGSLPGALAPLLPAAFTTAAALTGKDTDAGFFDTLQEKARALESVVRGAWSGALRNTQTFLVMAHDGAAGQLVLQDDRLRIEWPGVGSLPRFKTIARDLVAATAALGGDAVPNPVWNKLLGHDLITVHPLGGCGMADDASAGVVNDRCQVFSGASGNAVHDGLYVCDGAVIPRSLGINPLLTITALAERACLLMTQHNSWRDGWSDVAPPRAAHAEPALGIQFTETMRGHIALFSETNGALDFAAAAADGKQKDCEFLFTVTVVSDDLEQLLNTEAHPATLLGTAIAPSLSAQPLTIVGGAFQLFVRDPDVVGQRRMVYRMTLTSEEGQRYFLHGYKLVRDETGFDVWSDTTTLYITLYAGDVADDIANSYEQAPVLGRGILHIAPQDFAKQMLTMRARNAANTVQGLGAVARFGRFFAGVVAETYAKGVAPLHVFNPDAPPRAHRALRCGGGEVFAFDTADNVALRLTRYRGGNKGPLMLVHGLGVSSRIFSLDTIDTNLLEFLYANGYDVWLLDFRASIELPAAQLRSDGDDVARKDFPAAIAKIRAITGAASVQVLAHCFGASTFVMAMLNGLQGVRAAVLSQIGAHYRPPLLSKIKAGLYLPNLLDTLGIDSLTAYRDTHANWYERLLDDVLRLYPQDAEERTNSPVDRRIAFLYGQLWELDQLNTATHDALHELFGVANIAAFEHLALLLRKGVAVDARGDDVYLPQVQRLAIPIRIIHGAENQTFLPISTEQTFAWLCAANGAGLYDRFVVPGYGHIDCIFGKNAVNDVYPLMLEHLEKSALL